MKFLFKILSIIVAVVFILGALIVFFAYPVSPAQHITWGINFSQSHAEYLRLDWRKAYLAALNDLGARHIKLHTNWNKVENSKNNFSFTDIDWQLRQAENHNADIIYVVGVKTGRWPECHVPNWVAGLNQEEQQEAALNYIKSTVERYRSSSAIKAWQIENEPLFKFGQCPSWYYHNNNFLKTEIALVKLLDPSRPVIISDSGEQSLWLKAASLADMVGVTMYRFAWAHITDSLGFKNVFFLNTPSTYALKAALVKIIYDKQVICIELQAEPWTQRPVTEISVKDQLASMNPDVFGKNVAFARSTGLDTFYFWGAEWWYWMKEKHQKPEMWQAAKAVLQSGN